MQLGWIDFSTEERKKVLDVIHLLEEPGAVDELGFGIIRDGFSNYFFPGTSTVQTRAKYFLIVPYILKEAGDGEYGRDINRILSRIDDEERKCGLKLIEGSKDGVIGSLVLPKSWVARKPSDIYWNGIKALGIFKEKSLSIKEYIREAGLLRSMKNNVKLGNRNDTAEENEKDDNDAGDTLGFQFWKLPDVWKSNWRDELTIELLPEEAEFLRGQIEHELSGTLFAYLLKNNIEVESYEGFGAISEAVYDDVNDELKDMLTLANEFNHLVYLARIRYNVILSEGENEYANSKWDFYKKDLTRWASVDLNGIYYRLGVENRNTKKFLNNLQSLLLENNIEAVDKLIIEREIQLKTKNRAKLLKAGEYPKQDWVGGEFLDYRFAPAKRMISDIYKGEVQADV